MTTSLIIDRKAQLRSLLRADAQRYAVETRVAASAQICLRLEQNDLWRRGCGILFFFPMADEPDIRPLIKAALAQGKTAALPRYSPGKQEYEACELRDLEADLQSGAFGIREPSPSCSKSDLKKLDLILVPGIGFALNGLRLGRGKGFYDRLLVQTSGYKCGVAFDWQVTVEIPAEPHDICLDCILTPTRWHETKCGRAL